MAGTRTDRLLDVYERLPYPAKVAAASVRGARLRAWRYGRRTDALVEAALGRERWEEQRWREWQDRRLAEVLAHVRTQTPWYRDWFSDHPDHEPTALSSWPVMAKADVRAAGAALLADDRPRRCYVDHTSGTSGTPLVIHVSRPDLQAFFALHEARTRRWYGVSRHDRWAILGGQLVAAPGRSRPPYWVWNAALHQLYLSTHNVAPGTIGAYVEQLRRFAPSHLVVYPSSAAHLARLGLERGLTIDGPRVVITNAEPVTAEQRSVLEDFFGCPVRETYGMAEMTATASECEAGTLHLWPEVGVVELLGDGGGPVAEGSAGRLVLTGLVNDVTAFVRYDVGDRGRRPRWDVACPCGRTLPVMAPVEGRTQDMVVAADGGRQFWFNPVFYGLPVSEAQLVQDRLDHLIVHVVPAAGWGSTAEAAIVARLRDRLGEVDVDVDVTESIAREANGKFRPVVSLLEP